MSARFGKKKKTPPVWVPSSGRLELQAHLPGCKSWEFFFFLICSIAAYLWMSFRLLLTVLKWQGTCVTPVIQSGISIATPPHPHSSLTFNPFWEGWSLSGSCCSLTAFPVALLRISTSWRGLIFYVPHWFKANSSEGHGWVINHFTPTAVPAYVLPMEMAEPGFRGGDWNLGVGGLSCRAARKTDVGKNSQHIWR